MDGCFFVSSQEGSGNPGVNRFLQGGTKKGDDTIEDNRRQERRFTMRLESNLVDEERLTR